LSVSVVLKDWVTETKETSPWYAHSRSYAFKAIV
jgi:hypothetical protein